MCSRFTVTYRIEVAAKRFKIGLPHPDRSNWKQLFNIAPTDVAPVVTENGEGRNLDYMIFGLIPHWAKDAKIALSCLNARAETILEKPAFRESFKKRRCLVIADGFYEWKREGKIKMPYRVVLKSREPFAFAGIWDKWIRPDGKEVKSFSIITCEPNDLIKTIHTRSPVILDPAHEETWLDGSITDPERILPFLKPFPPQDFEMYEVSRYVSNSSNKGSESVEPI